MPRQPFRFVNLNPPAVDVQQMRDALMQAAAYQDIIGDPWGAAQAKKARKPEKPSKPLPRATPNGRMKNVKLGDIIKAYERKKAGGDYFEIIDFRTVKAGDYALTNTFTIEKVGNNPVGKWTKSPRIILNHTKAEEKLEQPPNYLWER